jgi:predicted Zn-dependent protease
METRRQGRIQKISAVVCYLTAVACTTAIVVACATTPETGRKQFAVIPESQMNSMGVQAYQDMLSKEKISKNKAQTEVIVRVGKAIAKASGKDFEWQFTLFDEPKTVNAFCLPGGKVGVYTGILPVVENEGGLAAVMGHEVAHAVLRHGAERMSQGLALQGIVAIGTLSFGDSKYRNMIAGALGIGAQFGVLLPYSRFHESEADLVGLKYLATAGYDPQESVYLWQRMAKLGGGGGSEITSTHPDPEKRAKALQDEIPKVRALYEKSAKKPSKKIPT